VTAGQRITEAGRIPSGTNPGAVSLGRGLSASGFIPIDGSSCRAPVVPGLRAPLVRRGTRVSRYLRRSFVRSRSAPRRGRSRRHRAPSRNSIPCSDRGAKLGEVGQASKRIPASLGGSIRGGGDGLYKLAKSREAPSGPSEGRSFAEVPWSRGPRADSRTKRRQRGTFAILYERRGAGGIFFPPTATNPCSSGTRLRVGRRRRYSR